MSANYRTLLAMSDNELITAHDRAAENTSVGVNYFLDELRRREQAATNRLIVRLTLANAALAAVAVVVSVVTLIITS